MIQRSLSSLRMTGCLTPCLDDTDGSVNMAQTKSRRTPKVVSIKALVLKNTTLNYLPVRG